MDSCFHHGQGYEGTNCSSFFKPVTFDLAPGLHELQCTTWRPEGTKGEQLSSFFVGGAPRLKLEEVCYGGGDRYRLQTRSSGVVELKIAIVMKDFAKHGVVC